MLRNKTPSVFKKPRPVLCGTLGYTMLALIRMVVSTSYKYNYIECILSYLSRRV